MAVVELLEVAGVEQRSLPLVIGVDELTFESRQCALMIKRRYFRVD